MRCCFFSWLTWPRPRFHNPRHQHRLPREGTATLEIPDGLGLSACIIHLGGHLSACNQGDWLRCSAVSPRVSCSGCWYYRLPSELRPSKSRNKPMIAFVSFPRRVVCRLMTLSLATVM